jgi:hypothetical protein
MHATFDYGIKFFIEKQKLTLCKMQNKNLMTSNYDFNNAFLII